jgi:hypothetical protein
MPVLGVVHSTKIGPDSPTITSVTDVGLNREYDNGAVDVAFSLPAVNTAVSYKVTSSNGQVATGASSPIRVQNLPTGINTTFTITGVNVITIEGPPSATSTGVVVTTVPFRPTMGVATAGNGQAFVVFTLLNSGGKQVISYVATGSPAGSGNNTGSPITVTSLNNDTPHAFTVIAINANGPSLASNPSNVVTPSTGGGGVPAGTFYCYSSDCFSQDGTTFAYLQAPIFTSVSPSDQSTTTPYSGGFGFARGTRVTYCNTVEATAATGAQQSSCQANYVAPNPPTPCDPTEYTSECGPYTTGAPVDGCSPTSASYGYTVTQTASKTRTIYDCNGIIISTTLLPCTISTFTATTNNDPRCPGYVAQQTTASQGGNTQVNQFNPNVIVGGQAETQQTATSGATVTYAGTTLTRDPAGAGYTDPATGVTSTWYSTVDNDGNTQLTLLAETAPGQLAGGNTNDEAFSFTIERSAYDYWSQADFGGYNGGQTAVNGGTATTQPTETYTTTNNDTTITTPFDTGNGSGGGGGGGGGGCFAYGTSILMADNSTKLIQDMKKGDVLKSMKLTDFPHGDDPSAWYPKSRWSSEDNDFEIVNSVVTYVKHSESLNYFSINDKYKVTYEHYILIKRANLWQMESVSNLLVGDFFIGPDFAPIEITSIKHVNEKSWVVDLDVEDNDFYFADGILVHNFKFYGDFFM